MDEKWKKLNKAPVIVAIFQIKLEQIEKFSFNEFINNDKQIRKKFPKRHDNYHSSIGVQGTPHPGVSFVKAKADTQINSYSYTTDDQIHQLVIEQGSIRCIFEGSYESWHNFKNECLEDLSFLQEQLIKCSIIRTSIRFINKFKFDTFDNPLDYFTTAISIDSDTKLNNPVIGFSYRFIQEVSGSSINTIVNHSLEKAEDKYDYYFDIDILDHEVFGFNFDFIDQKLEQMREIKNTIFFETLKEKTLEQCS